MLYLGLDGTQEELPHHTIYLSQDYQQNLRDIDFKRRFPTVPSFYVQNACVTDPTLPRLVAAPCTCWFPFHTSRTVSTGGEKTEFRRVVLRQLAKVGIEDVERRCRVEHVITPHDWQRQGIYRGATFNLAHSLGQMLHLRPRNRFEDFESVYLVGGGTHPGSGLPTIYSSARIASNSLMEDIGSCPLVKRRHRESPD